MFFEKHSTFPIGWNKKTIHCISTCICMAIFEGVDVVSFIKIIIITHTVSLFVTSYCGWYHPDILSSFSLVLSERLIIICLPWQGEKDVYGDGSHNYIKTRNVNHESGESVDITYDLYGCIYALHNSNLPTYKHFKGNRMWFEVTKMLDKACRQSALKYIFDLLCIFMLFHPYLYWKIYSGQFIAS